MSGLFSLAGAGIAAKGQIAQGNADMAAAEYNANIARQDAGIAASQTAADIAKTRNEQKQVEGQLKARAGVLGGLTGSNLDILSSNAVQQELDILNIKQQGALKQRALLNEASLQLAAGQNAKKQSKLQAAATMLEGTGKAIGSVTQFIGLGA